jgi:hypothetical protein
MTLHRRGMKKTKTWSTGVVLELLGRSEGCSIKGCRGRPTIAVAGDESGTTRMCLHHAAAWSESNLCRDVAQHNSGASRLALSTWLNIAQAPSLAGEAVS